MGGVVGVMARYSDCLLMLMLGTAYSGLARLSGPCLAWEKGSCCCGWWCGGCGA